ncbi:MAG: EAL domain-containing protein [Rhizobiaceae bacterium]|nr:EAL domain-containing protein [Rhizobiaceae bacterium]
MGRLLRAAARPAYLPSLVAAVVIAVAAWFADAQNQVVYHEKQRAEVLARASIVRARLEGYVSGNIQLVRGLVATISVERGLSQSRFDALARALFATSAQFRSIAIAPNMVVTMTYPLRGNERAIGLDYTRNEAQRDAALKARDTGQMVFAGPVDLVQGGRGFIGRFPVYIFSGSNPPAFWGLVSAVIDVDKLYADSGLLEAADELDIAITGRDATGAAGAPFFGDPAVFADTPVELDVLLPSGSWRIAARPKAGWAAEPGAFARSRALMALGALFILVPIVLAGRFAEDRQRFIGRLRGREAELKRLSRRLGLALDTSRVGVWECDLVTGELFWDDRLRRLYQLPEDYTPSSLADWSNMIHPDDRERALRESREAEKSRSRYSSDYRIVLPGGDVRHIRSTGSIYEDPGQSPRMIGVDWDVTSYVALNEELRQANTIAEARNAELEAAKASIEFNALHDSLTGLPNRRYLDTVLSGHAERFGHGERAALLHVDLDRFKQINDTLGHAAGDAMLVHAAQVLREIVGPRDFVARVGGDEFVVVLRRTGDLDHLRGRHLARLADSIVERMREPVMYQGHECRFGVSVGIAADTDAVADPTRLLVNADIALYRAKSRGRNRHQFFNDALQAEISATKRMADEILAGIEHRQFVAHYQPQFDATTHEIIGVEALARWNHPTDGTLAPAAFMRIAEELNVVDTIDRHILDQALADLAGWQKAGLAIPKASVNVSARRLHDEELINGLTALDIAPGTISFELVESIFLDEHDELIAWNVDRIKQLGIDVEIDDFGTGYASIVSLLKLRPRRLKIDRQLIMPIVRSPAQRQLVGSIIDIGHSLGVEVLAEGVETMEHAHILKQLGCDALQGYAFARPMSAADLATFARTRQQRRLAS